MPHCSIAGDVNARALAYSIDRYSTFLTVNNYRVKSLIDADILTTKTGSRSLERA